MENSFNDRAGIAGEYRLSPSWRLAAILAAGHGAVAVIVLLLEVAPIWKIGFIALLAISLGYELRNSALRLSAQAVVALRVSKDNLLSVQTRRGEWRDFNVAGSSFVTSTLTVLNLRAADSHRMQNVVLLPDSMAAEDFRRLRTWLRWRPQSREE